MNHHTFILDVNGEPIPEPDLLSWIRWWIIADGGKTPWLRHVGLTEVGTVKVSTVFLTSDHNFGFRGGPILWETMVFGGAMDQECERCGGSREQAEAMHARWVEKVSELEAQQKQTERKP